MNGEENANRLTKSSLLKSDPRPTFYNLDALLLCWFIWQESEAVFEHIVFFLGARSEAVGPQGDRQPPASGEQSPQAGRGTRHFPGGAQRTSQKHRRQVASLPSWAAPAHAGPAEACEGLVCPRRGGGRA